MADRCLPRYPTIIHKHVAYPHVPGAGAVGAVGRSEDVRLSDEDAAAKELPAAVVQAGRPGELPVARVGAAHDPVGGVPAVDAALAGAPQGAVKATPVGQELGVVIDRVWNGKGSCNTIIKGI